MMMMMMYMWFYWDADCIFLFGTLYPFSLIIKIKNFNFFKDGKPRRVNMECSPSHAFFVSFSTFLFKV